MAVAWTGGLLRTFLNQLPRLRRVADEPSPERARRRRGSFIRFLRTEYAPDATVPASAIYECSECESITAFKQGERFLKCEDCPYRSDGQTWYRTNEIVHFVSKNLNTEFDRIETFSIRVADGIAEVAGNVWFIYIHVLWFAFWIYVNTGHELFGVSGFDPYPFGFLTMVVSLEAIFLSTFILVAQNLQAQKSELRAELDYQTNLKSEKGVAEILAMLHEMRENEQTLFKTANEVLHEAGIRHADGKTKRGPKRKRVAKHHARRAKRVLKEAGIDVVRPQDE